MQYRTMGPRVSEQVSALGFGCMRFPKTDEDTHRIERSESRRIRYLGFSFHDEAPVFRVIVDQYDSWDFYQIQYHCMNEKDQAGTAGLKYAAERDIAVVVMEPLLGGSLANIPEDRHT